MGTETKIQWTDYTFNPWIGCTKVSPGCAHCYAEEQDNFRFSKTLGGATEEQPISHWGKGAPRYRTSTSNWKEPLRWNKAACAVHHIQRCEECPRPRVFCASLADWLDEEVPIEWLADLLKLIHDTPNLDWLLLTKRPGNWRARLQRVSILEPVQANDAFWQWIRDWVFNGKAPANVWMGTTVENQAMADERIPELLRIPAAVRFLSCEPLLEGVDLSEWLHIDRDVVPGAEGMGEEVLTGQQIHWAIIGGESGPKARGCGVQWIRSLVGECRAAGVAAFVKQLGARPHEPLQPKGQEFRQKILAPMKDPKGGDMAEWPEELRVREWPPVAPVGQ